MDHLQIALTQYAQKEITGRRDNPEILKYFSELGYDAEALKDETAWCSAFVNWVCKTAGLPYTGKLNARSWQHIGEEVTKPVPGDIVVFWRVKPHSWQGHVGFFIRETDSLVYVLGGNQKNRVRISAYPKSRLLEYRRLTKKA